MSLNPLNELKRRLDDDTTPLPKRLCLAKNIVISHHFPTAPKERVIAEWLDDLMNESKLTGTEFHRVVEWSTLDDLTGELKTKLVQVVSKYVQKNILQNEDIKAIITFLENPKISLQLCQQINECLTITVTLLQILKNDETENLILSEKLLNNILKHFKESKKKLDFIVKFLKGENLETVFSYLDTECRTTVLNLCQTILFPPYKKTFFISYLKTLIRKDNIEELLSEKGDNVQSVLKIMNIFFNFPEHRSDTDPKFLRDFIDVFTNCFRKEHQVVFAFYILVTNILQMEQEYIIPSTAMKPVTFTVNSEKIKRNLLLNMLEIILQNEIDITVRLTDTFGEKISKVETKKNFMSFLQIIMMGQIKLEGKLDKTTLQIIKMALKLDPILVEQKMVEILPPIMASKKSANIQESYKEMFNCLLEILFKLSRGTQFLSLILPSVRLHLEASNTEQKLLAEEIKSNEENGVDCGKLKSKLITGKDVFPQECVELYGKLTTDLMFRQNKELLEILQKDLEENCVLVLEEGLLKPSTLTLTEVLSSVLSSFLRHCKMSDHTVPQHIAADFWSTYTQFRDCLTRLGKCVLTVRNNSLLNSFLEICIAYSQLKLLNIKYSNCKLALNIDPSEEHGVFDLNVLLPCLTNEQWRGITGMAQNETVVLLDNLLLIKAMILQVLSIDTDEITPALSNTKSHLIKQLSSNQVVLENGQFSRGLSSDLDKNQSKQLAKVLVKMYFNDQGEIFNDIAITNNRTLLNALVLEAVRNITKCLENCDTLSKALNKVDFEISSFAKQTDMQTYFNNINLVDNSEDKIKKCIEILKLLRIPYLEENYQLTAIFVLLAVKKCSQTKKIKRSIDYIFQNIFELSLYAPDMYQLFPINFLFSFEDMTMMDLLTLKIKTSNQMLVIKSTVEKAVKRVKVDSDLVKNIVEILLSKKLKKSSIEVFSDPAFQIICIALPLIVKQRRAMTVGAFRSILAELQEKLHQILLETFKNINFRDSSLFNKTGNTEDSVVESESNVAALNALPAYALTLSKYCETTDVQELQKLDCLWSGLEFFIQNAIQSLSNPDSKPHHVESSIQLLHVTLRHIKKLETHAIFNEKDKLFIQIWNAICHRLQIVFKSEGGLANCVYLDELSVTLKFVCELVSVEGFEGLAGDVAKLIILKKPIEIIKDETNADRTNHLVIKHIWTQCLKANTVGPKCAALTKLIYQNSRNLKAWIRQHYDSVHSVASKRKRKLEVYSEEKELKVVRVHDDICDILRVDLEMLSEAIFAGKKIILDYKFLDCIFELQHLVHHIMGCNAVSLRCEITWQSFFKLFEGSVAVLNSLLVSREELLEDRWPCYMQCYRALVTALCEHPSIRDSTDRIVEEKISEAAHSIEKLTQAISKRKKQVSRIAAYTVADLCTILEKNAPSRKIRQHLENSIASLMQASDSTYAMAFLKRALAGSVGQMTMTNLYTAYKRYHKYTGNA